MKTFACIFTLIISVVLIEACDLFQTREPQPPSQTNSNRKQPVTPDIVLDNLKSAISDARVEDYMFCLVDTSASSREFQFIPSPEVAAAHASLFDSWSLQEERNYFKNLGTSADVVPFLTFSNQRQLTTSSDSVVYNMDYTLFFPHHRTGIPQLVRGNMQINLATDRQQRWSIYRWQDFKSTADSTWSLWKATF